MKELKVLKGFEELKIKRVLLYDVDFDIFITYDKEILMFEAEYESTYMEFKSKEEINDYIVRDIMLRKLLISNEVIDDEYFEGLLKEKEDKKRLKEEEIKQRKLNQYNKLKAELGLK